MQRHIPTLPSDHEMELAEIDNHLHEVKMQHLREHSQHPAMRAWRERRAAQQAQEAQSRTDAAFHGLINFNQQGTLF